MLYACILLTDLAMDAVQRRRADPSRPLALLEGPSMLRRVAAANPAAAVAGVRAGMKAATAQLLCQGLETLDIGAADVPHWHRFLAAWAYRHSSLVTMQWEHALVLEVRASFRLFGPWPRFEARLRGELEALGFAHRIALAPTPRAARVLAGVRDGLAIESSAALHDVLGQVPLAAALLPDDAAPRLAQMGVKRLAQLRELPRDGLRRRFGPHLLDHLDALHGSRDDPLALYQPPDRFDARIELGYETDNTQALLFPLKRLLADLATFLSIRDEGVQRFELRLEHERLGFIGEKTPQATRVEVGLLAAERDPALLFELARNRLERVQVARAVVALRLVAESLPPFVPASRDLFDPRPQQAQDWPQLRERLRARLGDAAVYQLRCTPDPRPERAFRRATEGDPARDAGAPLPARPAWLLPRPIPLRDHGPRIVAGPERLESGWWDGEDARRDYYVLQLSTGQRAWAFAPPGEQGGWMLQGWFA